MEKRRRIDEEKLLVDLVGEHNIVINRNFLDKKTFLFEIPKDLESSLHEGLKIVGSESDAVLCSSTSTYSVKRVETSNEVYVVIPTLPTSDVVIESKCRDYFELTQIAGKVESIPSLLKNSVYISQSLDTSVDREKLLSYSHFLDSVQASVQEIQRALPAFHVVEINGYMRLLDEKVLHDSMELLLAEFTARNTPSYDDISEEQLLAWLPSFDPHYLKAVLAIIGEPLDAIKSWKIDYDKVAIQAAHMTFRSCLNETVDAQEFLRNWSANLPGDSIPKESLLEGVALEEIIHGCRKFRYFPLDRLSRDPKMRFKELFQNRRQFTLAQLEPYLQDLFGHNGQPKTCTELILQHAKLLDGYFVPK